MATVVLLGPQRLQPIVHRVIAELELAGPVAAITAGWREREQEDDELADLLEDRTYNLELHRRGDEVLDEAPEIRSALEQLRTERRAFQDVYRMRLNHALAAVRQLAREPSSKLLDEELDDAFESVRTLDRHHLDRITRLEAEFRRRWANARRRAIRRHRAEVDELLDDCPVVAIAGGHVGALTELLRLFGLESRLRQHHVIAWSAGAMALGNRVVLFHDNPPQGFGNAEIWGPGLGIYQNYLPMPNARTRLDLADPQRVSILARRFQPLLCLPMDEGELLTLRDGKLATPCTARRLQASGKIVELCP